MLTIEQAAKSLEQFDQVYTQVNHNAGCLFARILIREQRYLLVIDWSTDPQNEGCPTRGLRAYNRSGNAVYAMRNGEEEYFKRDDIDTALLFFIRIAIETLASL